jgi:DNA mismatch endonuclease, patch repair protein
MRFKRVERRLADDADLFTSRGVSLRMAEVRRSGSGPELVVRSAARQLGLRYRVKNANLPGSPDLANRSRKWAVFVHGCYWHRHQACAGASIPKRNREFWLAKFKANRMRDKRVVRELSEKGFLVITLWECETNDVSYVTAQLRQLKKTGVV